MKINKWMLALVLGVIVNTASCGDLTHFKLTVVDEEGVSVENALVRMGFFDDNPSTNHSPRRTDADGVVSAVGFQRWGIRINVTKEGYYQSERRVNTDYNDVQITLRAIKNKVPMYAHGVNLSDAGRIYDIWIGFDLMKADYVAPYGVGEVIDFEFRKKYEGTDFLNYHYELDVRFPNKGDGLLPYENNTHESTFNSDYNAPERGYKAAFSFFDYRVQSDPIKTNFDKSRNYYLRVRSVFDEEGNLVSGHYGKIHGDFPKFYYYLNATLLNRSVEISENLLNNIRGRSKKSLSH